MAGCIGGLEDTSPLGIKLKNTPASSFDGMEKQYDKVNPDHYKTREMECIDEMFALYGAECVLHYCICCVHKYRYRAGNKVGEDRETDLRKSDWYAKLARNIRDDYSLNV